MINTLRRLLGRGRAVAAVNLDGGMTAWAAAGLPLTTDRGTPGRVA